jgi:hypothetical protein
MVDLEDVAGLHHEGFLQTRESQVFGQAGVLRELAELAVNGHEIARPHQVEHQLHFLHAGVPGDVQRRVHAAVHDVGPAARHVVDHAEDGLLIAGNDARAQNHRVAPVHGDLFVVVDGHARERRHRLALSARNEDGDFVGRKVHDILRAKQNPVGNIEQAERMGDFGDRDHAAADYGDTASVFLGEIEHQLDAVDGGTETGDHNAALRTVENLLHAGADGALALGIPGPVGIGGIGEQQLDATLAVVGERVQVEKFIVGGRGIHLEIAGVNNHAKGGGDRHGDSADDGVGDVQKLHLEWADFHYLFGLDGDQPGLLLEFVFFEPAFHQGQGERRSVDGDVYVAQKIRNGPDVVLMAVSQQEGSDLGLILLEEGQIGHDQVDTEEFSFGKHHAGIHHDDVFAEANGRHVHAEFA